ncbi:hypothetical protein HMPREF9412_6475 [Paenibacillus sp. HGF5]|nr:hypothetical protein HMPREF9412_6475 [Paenibacillus sp. HGF5]
MKEKNKQATSSNAAAALGSPTWRSGLFFVAWQPFYINRD